MDWKSPNVCIVFSHPNHELAVFGILQRLKPHILYLTDGGGEERVAQTKLGLSSIGLLENAVLLNFTETQFYDALIDRDVEFYKEVSRKISEWLLEHRPDQVFCDAVEFYNPVHDMALPLVLGKGGANHPWEIFEIPLVYQSALDTATYELQRMPEFRSQDTVEFVLSDAELAKKLCARDEIYQELSKQMGPLLSTVSPEHAQREVIARAKSPLAQIGKDRFLRYEARAELLQSQGAIRFPIRYTENYLPVVSSLLPSV